jgi:hypothetical protein
MSKKFTVACGPKQLRIGRGALQKAVVRAYGNSIGDNDDDDDGDYNGGGSGTMGQTASKKRAAERTPTPSTPTTTTTWQRDSPLVSPNPLALSDNEGGHMELAAPTQEADDVHLDDDALFWGGHYLS